ncbi:MAG: DUF721 domain-containing protein [Alistipes sp.]|jgi:hypothetical protein|nr:DUF721 domain-containing protein [Alistipes sp.]
MKRTRTHLIGDVLDEFFKRPHIAAKIAEGKIPEFWRIAVGEHFAAQTADIQLINQILYVRIISSVARQELFYKRDHIMIRINELAGRRLINSIIIR